MINETYYSSLVRSELPMNFNTHFLETFDLGKVIEKHKQYLETDTREEGARNVL